LKVGTEVSEMETLIAISSKKTKEYKPLNWEKIGIVTYFCATRLRILVI